MILAWQNLRGGKLTGRAGQRRRGRPFPIVTPCLQGFLADETFSLSAGYLVYLFDLYGLSSDIRFPVARAVKKMEQLASENQDFYPVLLLKTSFVSIR